MLSPSSTRVVDERSCALLAGGLRNGRTLHPFAAPSQNLVLFPRILIGHESQCRTTVQGPDQHARGALKNTHHRDPLFLSPRAQPFVGLYTKRATERASVAHAQNPVGRTMSSAATAPAADAAMPNKLGLTLDEDTSGLPTGQNNTPCETPKGYRAIALDITPTTWKADMSKCNVCGEPMIAVMYRRCCCCASIVCGDQKMHHSVASAVSFPSPFSRPHRAFLCVWQCTMGPSLVTLLFFHPVRFLVVALLKHSPCIRWKKRSVAMLLLDGAGAPRSFFDEKSKRLFFSPPKIMFGHISAVVNDPRRWISPSLVVTRAEDSFTWLNHRHKCRNCQEAVCNGCSKSRKVCYHTGNILSCHMVEGYSSAFHLYFFCCAFLRHDEEKYVLKSTRDIQGWCRW